MNVATARKRKPAAVPPPAPAAGAPVVAGRLDAMLPAIAALPIFPVRHHSPRTSATLRAFLDAHRPEVVMIEAPRDAAPVIPVLFDADTEPPVAILSYRTDGAPASSLYPMATYSPEYVALRWAHEHGARVECIDLASGERLAYDAAQPEPDHDDGETIDASVDTVDDPDHALALEHGFRSFEELWEAWFEAPAYEAEAFRAVLLAWCAATRLEGRPIDRIRDTRMARHLAEELERGTAPERIAVVVGGAHAAALVNQLIDPALDGDLPPAFATAVTVIPYSFLRLAAQTGYGAGNRAPRYYQRAHDRGCDYTRATLELLLEFTEHLRLRGFAASLADAIEAYRLALTLTDLRGKSAPGLDELRDATVATMCRGDRSHVDGFLWPAVVGASVGRVGVRVGRNSLQDEFWREVRARGLPATDEAALVSLTLADPTQIDASVFLHRLRLAEIPYATYRGSHAIGAGGGDERAGGYDALARVRERWEAQWTPSTDVALVERVVLGDSLAAVVDRLLTARLTAATSAAVAAEVLLEAVVARAPEVVGAALTATERLAATDDDLGSLAGTARALAGLCSYRSARADAATLEIYQTLLARTFARAVLRLNSAAIGDDQAIAPVREAMRVLHELAVAQPAVDGELWFAAARALPDDARVHPACAGLAVGLGYLSERLAEAEVVAMVGQRLSSVVEPQAGAAFLEGFLDVNALVLVRNRAIVAALDGFLQSMDTETFRAISPLLRRAFATLGATERRYLVENLVALRQLGDASTAAKVIAARDAETLAALDDELGAAMADLDDLL